MIDSYDFGLGQFELPVESLAVALDPSADGAGLVIAPLSTRRGLTPWKRR